MPIGAVVLQETLVPGTTVSSRGTETLVPGETVSFQSIQGAFRPGLTVPVWLVEFAAAAPPK